MAESSVGAQRREYDELLEAQAARSAAARALPTSGSARASADEVRPEASSVAIWVDAKGRPRWHLHVATGTTPAEFGRLVNMALDAADRLGRWAR